MTIAEQITRAKADYDEVYETGKKSGEKSEYDRFWDNYQNYGKRDGYVQGFSGHGWTDITFRPKYDIILTDAVRAFSYCKITDLEARLNECGVVLNMSKSLNNSEVFANSTITVIPEITIPSNATTFSNMFGNCKNLHTIRKIILLGENNVTWYRAFYNCSALENLIIEGVLCGAEIAFQWSTKLNKESITSIINCLSTTTSGLTVTLSKTAVDTAFETSEGANDGSASTEWTTLIATKSNWTISLI